MRLKLFFYYLVLLIFELVLFSSLTSFSRLVIAVLMRHELRELNGDHSGQANGKTSSGEEQIDSQQMSEDDIDSSQSTEGDEEISRTGEALNDKYETGKEDVSSSEEPSSEKEEPPNAEEESPRIAEETPTVGSDERVPNKSQESVSNISGKKRGQNQGVLAPGVDEYPTSHNQNIESVETVELPPLQVAKEEIVVKDTTPKTQLDRDSSPEALRQRLRDIGSPVTLNDKHFTLKFSNGLELNASVVEEVNEKRTGFARRAVADEPKYVSENDVFLAVDLDDPEIGSDVRLVHFSARPEACETPTVGACKVEYVLPDVGIGRRTRRILFMGFTSPTGTKFKMGNVLKLIQKRPNDVDLRRISLSRFLQDHKDFFANSDGNIVGPGSWNTFKLSGASGEGNQQELGHPLIELPPNATPEEQQEAIAAAHDTGAEVDGVTTPVHGGYSPGSGGEVGPSTIFKYVLASLLIISIFVAILVATSKCVSAK